MELQMASRAEALSFAALVDGYFRLTVDAHHFLCKEVAPASVVDNINNGCHGPICTEYAIYKLRQEGNEEGTYILRWSCTDYQYIIITVVCTELDLRESRPVRQYKNFQIEVGSDGFRLYGTETFRKTLGELLEHLEGQSLRTDNVHFQLLRCCPPQPREGEANLQLWDLQSGQLIKALYQKKVDSWCPSWSDDEKISVRSVNNELHFYENNDFNSIANKLHMQKVSDFVLSPGAQPSKVVVYVPGSKGAPSFVRLYQYPVLGGPTAALANKSFFKADRVTMQWNKRASAVLVTASTEVDKTGASYYGEQTLHYLAVNGETALVQLQKSGPIYDVAWSPNSAEFCVVYGFMPAKATVFNLKCDPVFDFGTGPRNAAYYSPQGHILVLAGFGNLRGQMEVWDVKKYKQVSKPQAPDATHFSWCPDGEHVVTATCSPRLRVSNGFKVWHYTGSVLHKWDVAAGSELWEVRWQPFPDGSFPERPVKYQAAPSELGTTQAPPTQAYRPPALRHLPATPSAKLHEEEPPQNMRPGASGEKSLSKSALKNQKKREAKKAAKQEAKPESPSEPAPVSNSQSEPSSGDPETDKKMKNLKKKLKAIEELKEQQAAGKVLQKNQLEKVQKEEQLLKELEELQIGQ